MIPRTPSSLKLLPLRHLVTETESVGTNTAHEVSAQALSADNITLEKMTTNFALYEGANFHSMTLVSV